MTSTEDEILEIMAREGRCATGVYEKKKSIVDALDGSDYESGALEAAAKTAENNSRLLSKLIVHLVEVGELRKQDAAKIIRESVG